MGRWVGAQFGGMDNPKLSWPKWGAFSICWQTCSNELECCVDVACPQSAVDSSVTAGNMPAGPAWPMAAWPCRHALFTAFFTSLLNSTIASAASAALPSDILALLTASLNSCAS